jgi:hypothetical protein
MVFPRKSWFSPASIFVVSIKALQIRLSRAWLNPMSADLGNPETASQVVAKVNPSGDVDGAYVEVVGDRGDEVGVFTAHHSPAR